MSADDGVGSGETIVVVGRMPGDGAPDRDRALDDAPFVTIVHPDDQPATASVADALATSAGVQARSLGGPGAYESVSVRGNVPGQTEVLIDGIPLARLAAVTTDLGRFALDGFGQVELYRGAVPVDLGGAGVGGAIDMVTLLGPGAGGELASVTLGAGSFGAKLVRARYGDAYAGGRWLSSVTAGYQRATGDFPFYSTNNTPLDPHDDSTQIRRNDGYDQVDVSARLGRADRAVVGGVRVAWKDQGLPGAVSEPSLSASLSTLDVIADARGEQAAGDGLVTELGYAVVEDQHLRDPSGELGLGAETRIYRTLSAGAQTSWRGAPGEAGVELRADSFRDTDDTGEQPTVTGARAGGAVLASHDLVLAPELIVTLAARVDALRTAPAPLTVGPMALAPIPARWDVIPSPRVAVRAPVAPDVAIKGSAGWYVREPTLVELFGDRGFLLGTPTLRPEQGPSADLGAVWAPLHGVGDAIDRVMLEADGFATQPRDTIAFITTAGYVARAANIGRTESYGAEVTASARVARALSLSVAYTRVATAQLSADPNVDGREVPRTPGHLLYARGELAHAIAGHQVALWVDGTYQATSYLDPANLGEVPPRLLVGAGARVDLGARFTLALDVTNLTDLRVVDLPLSASSTMTTPVPVTDVAGFPLPGRALYLSLHWSYRP
nr:TonB-dependent receptor [Kofleriaceae bacterium]